MTTLPLFLQNIVLHKRSQVFVRLGLLVSVGVIAAGVFLFSFLGRQTKQSSIVAIPTPTPTPRPIPSGKKTFSISSGKKTGPQFRNGAIDPYDPKAGSPQTISVSIVSSKPVATVKLTMETDTTSREMQMKAIGGTTTEGTWAGTWTVDDTYLYTYNATITATDGKESNNITLTLR